MEVFGYASMAGGRGIKLSNYVNGTHTVGWNKEGRKREHVF